MEITYESICQKLGFNPIKDSDKINEEYRKTCKGHEDDSQPSPFSVLTFEEELFLLEYFNKHNSFKSLNNSQ